MRPFHSWSYHMGTPKVMEERHLMFFPYGFFYYHLYVLPIWKVHWQDGVGDGKCLDVKKRKCIVLLQHGFDCTLLLFFLPFCLFMLEANKSVFHSHSFLLFIVAICCCCSWNQTKVYLTPPSFVGCRCCCLLILEAIKRVFHSSSMATNFLQKIP